MLCKCQVWDFFCRFKFSIFCCFASLKHINNGRRGPRDFFYRTQQKYKIFRAYSNSRMKRSKKYKEEFRLQCRKKEQIKSLPATWNRCWIEPAAAESNHSAGPPLGSPPRRRCTCCCRPPAPWSASSTRGTLSHSGGPQHYYRRRSPAHRRRRNLYPRRGGGIVWAAAQRRSEVRPRDLRPGPAETETEVALWLFRDNFDKNKWKCVLYLE